MIKGLRNNLKKGAGSLIAGAVPQYRYENLIVMIGHMRSGSTALSNVICEHPQISGFGEAHIRYDGAGSLGVLALSQWRRGTLRRNAPFLYDKINHNRYDDAAQGGLDRARAVFLARNPAPTLPSIQRIFAHLETDVWDSMEHCGTYYAQRMEHMLGLWHQFPADRRVAVVYDDLVADPDAEIARISAMLGLEPPLRNEYSSRPASTRDNAGDHLESAKHTAIQPIPAAGRVSPKTLDQLDLSPGMVARLEDLYARYCEIARAGS